MADLHSTLVHHPIEYGRPVALSPLVQRITANNPSVFTGPGTNTYLVGRERFSVIDPGPDDPDHVAAILSATGGRIDNILATHAHPDHSPATLALVKACGARVLGQPVDSDDETLDQTFAPDETLLDGERVNLGEVTLQAIATPGHLRRHLCYLLAEEDLLFAGDHVMQGASVVIIPDHGGTMWEYLDSLRKLQGRGLRHLAPAHGHLLAQPDQVLQELIDHRLEREQKAIAALRQLRSATTAELAPLVYPEVGPELLSATHMVLWAHMRKLVHDGIARSHRDSHWLNAEVVWDLVE